jgi:N-acetylglucosaminyldiphosphoundecaprenol N-acetyl-beta-D-mannosaminyltransferase
MVPISVKFLGVKVSLMNRDEFKEFLIQTIYDKERFRVVILDEKKLFLSFFNKELRDIINNTEIVLCSSQTVAWAAKMFTKREIPVVMPVTLVLDMMRAADEMGYTVFLFGGNKNVNIETAKRMKRSFANARVVGNYHANIKHKELEDVLVAIRKSSPQIFFAGLNGGAKQEKWLADKEEFISNSVVVGVDNAFQVISGRQKMPPISVQQKGRIGLYRSVTHPYNIARFFRIVVIFFVAVTKKIFNK